MILDKINSLHLANKFVKEKDKPWIIFAGSAISFKDPSNLPSVKKVKSTLAERLASYGGSKLNKNYKNKVLEYKDYLVDGKYSSIFSEIPFETFLSFFYRSIANFSDFILDLYGIRTNKLYNINHNIIGLLVREGFVRQVITTNYDLLLEEAFKECFRLSCETFIIQNIKKGEIERLISDTALSENLKRKPIVKLHGCCSVKKTIVFTEEGVDQWRESISCILPLLLDKANIIFIGYSGRDEIDIMPIIGELSINERITIYWLTRPGEEEENLPKDLNFIQVIHDLDNSSGDNMNALIAIAKKTGIFSEIKISPKKNFARSINSAKKVSSAIDEIFKREKYPHITSLRILTSIFEHLKIGDIALNLASIAKSIDEGSFSALDYGRFFEILRLYPVAITYFLRGIKSENISDRERLYYYCSIAFCNKVMGKLSIAHKYYKKAFKLAPKDLKELDIHLIDQLLRGKVELLLYMVEMRFAREKTSKKRIMEARNLLNKLEQTVSWDNNIKALILRNKARIQIIEGDGNKDFENAKKMAQDAFNILKARNQLEGMTVVSRTLAAADPKRAFNILIPLMKKALERRYWQEFLKLIIELLVDTLFRSQKIIRTVKKFVGLFLSIFWIAKSYISVLFWYLRVYVCKR